jgi:hypothetical protein
MLFAHDQILLAKSEDDLQYSVYNLNTAVELSMGIKTEKLKLQLLWMESIGSKYALMKG